MSDDFMVGTAPQTPSVSISNASTTINHTGSWKYIRPAFHDRVAPCIAGCPTAVDIQGYLTLLRDGRIDDACKLLLMENPIPAITGRVCNHPCEDECNRGAFDGAVAVHAIERMLGDRILAQPLPQPIAPTREERIAVVGSGPAGIACAYHLVSVGYPVEIFEQDEQPGGMLRVGIPEYRLPRDVLDTQFERLSALGIRIHCGKRVGEEVSWATLTSDFAALFVATGAHVSKALGVTAPATRSLWSGLDMLRAVNAGERPMIGRRAVVIGGGNTAMDCARTALRLGAEVTVVYRRTRAEMPAIEEEIADAEREGVSFVFLAAPQRILQSVHGLTLICRRMELGGAGADGRRAVVESRQPAFPIETDTIITAIGEDAELNVLPEGLTEGKAIEFDEWGTSRIDNIFVGGDMAGDTRTVANALGAGKRAAIGIDRFLRACRGEVFDIELVDRLSVGGVGAFSMARWTKSDPVERVAPLDDLVAIDDINFNHFEHAQRHDDHRSDYTLPFAETNLGLSKDEALREAARCFQCGVCTQCDVCMIYCGDVAITRGTNGARFDINLDYCKGCGVCAEECPRGAIVMTREGL